MGGLQPGKVRSTTCARLKAASTFADRVYAESVRASRIAINAGCGENNLFPRSGTKTQRDEASNTLVFLAPFATLSRRRGMKGSCSPWDQSRPGWAAFWGIERKRSSCPFHDGNQQSKATHKKMLKMKVDPNISLKINEDKIQIIIMPVCY
jgi:hypothetical protein